MHNHIPPFLLSFIFQIYPKNRSMVSQFIPTLLLLVIITSVLRLQLSLLQIYQKDKLIIYNFCLKLFYYFVFIIVKKYMDVIIFNVRFYHFSNNIHLETQLYLFHYNLVQTHLEIAGKVILSTIIFFHIIFAYSVANHAK